VLAQEIQLVAGLQHGMHQPGFTHPVLSGEERHVINMDRNLERCLDPPEAERATDGVAGRLVPM
jgi:choline monooxygenase